MSFFDKLQKKTSKYFNSLVDDPEDEAAEKKRLKNLKAAVADAKKKLQDETTLLKKAQKTKGPGPANQATAYSIFPEDAREYQAYLVEASRVVGDATEGDDVREYMKERFGEEFETYKINSIFNTNRE